MCAAAAIIGLASASVRSAALSVQDHPLQFESRTQGVLVDVEVTSGGRPVADLVSTDFDLRDNGVRQDFSMARISGGAISAVLALDVSASTKGQRLQDLVAASRVFLRQLRAGDHAGLVTFGDRIVGRVPLTKNFETVRQPWLVSRHQETRHSSTACTWASCPREPFATHRWLSCTRMAKTRPVG